MIAVLLQDFQGQIQPASIIFVSGSKSRPTNFQILKKLFDSAQIHVFTISYPSTAFPDMIQLSQNNGKHYSIHDSASSMYTVTSLSQVFSDLLGKSFLFRKLIAFFSIHVSIVKYAFSQFKTCLIGFICRFTILRALFVRNLVHTKK